jgi:hypothetical protein
VYDRAPRYQVVDTEYGAMYAAYRPADDGQAYWRYAQFLFPFYIMIRRMAGGSSRAATPASTLRAGITPPEIRHLPGPVRKRLAVVLAQRFQGQWLQLQHHSTVFGARRPEAPEVRREWRRSRREPR